MNEEEVKVTETAAESKAENQTAEVKTEPTMASVIHDPNAPVVSVKELLETGAHFGHMTKSWNPAYKDYVFATRSGIHIINLDVTAKKICEDYKILRDIVAKGGKVLFVGTKKAAKDIVTEEAIRSGSFYAANRWLGGTLTNFKVIATRAKLLKSLEQLEIDGVYDTMPKKTAIENKKTQAKLAATLEGIKEMRKTPDAMVVVDPKTEHNAVHEAMLLHIPVFALIGTNADPRNVTYPIPCNDDSSKTIKLIVGILADAVVEGKGGDVSYAYVKEDGDAINFNDTQKTVDRMEDFKLIRMKIREDQYNLRMAKKSLKKGMRMRKKLPFGAKKFGPRPTRPMDGKDGASDNKAPVAEAPVADKDTDVAEDKEGK